MHIVACYKCVPEEQQIEIRANQSLDLTKAQWKLGLYDLNALEAAVGLASEGDRVIVLTAAGEAADHSKLRKDILSRGAGELFALRAAELERADSLAVAKALKAGIERIGSVDLVLCGEGSGDFYGQQVGPLLGGLLGWTTVNAVSHIALDGPTLLLERSLESGVEELRAPLPAVISVTSDSSLPRIPVMRDILAAGRKPFTVWPAEEAGWSAPRGTEEVSLLAPERTERRQIVLEGDGEEQIDLLFQHVRKLL